MFLVSLFLLTNADKNGFVYKNVYKVGILILIDRNQVVLFIFVLAKFPFQFGRIAR